MGALPFIIGGGALVALLAVASSKAKASTSTSSTTPTPTGTKPTATTSASVPAQIVEAVLKGSSQTIAQGQAIWLNDNGYPKTGQALRDYLEGEATLDELRAIAATEVKTAPTVLTPSKPTGVNTRDLYGESLLSAGTNDEILAYAQGSDSIPFVTAAAAHLAAAGDTRAMLLTQHLVDITT
jgi:DNA-directed RNA polymerase specialized sigma54-like protein